MTVHSPLASGADRVIVAATYRVVPSAQLGVQSFSPTVPRPVALWWPQLDQWIPVTTSPSSPENWMTDGLVPSNAPATRATGPAGWLADGPVNQDAPSAPAPPPTNATAATAATGMILMAAPPGGLHGHLLRPHPEVSLHHP